MDRTPKMRTVDLESALLKRLDGEIGFGCFHVLIMVFGSMILLCLSLGTITTSLVMPVNERDLELSSSRKGGIEACLFVGMLVGSLLFGWLSDACGRRTALLWAIPFTGASLLFSAFSFHWAFFLVMVFCIGVGTGGSIVTLVTYIAECSAERLRGPLLIVVQSFQDISIACATFLAWALMGTNGEVSQMSVQLGSLRFTAWRLYLVLCATFVLLVVAPVLCVPESPLFLLHSKQDKKLQKLLERMQRLNSCGRTRGKNYTLCPLPHPLGSNLSLSQKANTVKESLSNTELLTDGPQTSDGSHTSDSPQTIDSPQTSDSPQTYHGMNNVALCGQELEPCSGEDVDTQMNQALGEDTKMNQAQGEDTQMNQAQGEDTQMNQAQGEGTQMNQAQRQDTQMNQAQGEGGDKDAQYGGGEDQAEGHEDLSVQQKHDGIVMEHFSGHNFGRAVLELVHKLIKLISTFYCSSHAYKTIILHVVFFTTLFGYYGAKLWFPEIFKRISIYKDAHPFQIKSHSVYQNQSGLREPYVYYQDALFIALSTIPSNIVAAVMFKALGAKILLVGSSLIASVGGIAMWFVPMEHAVVLALCCVYNASISLALNALKIGTANLYPTAIRSTALGLHSAVGRLGAISANIVFGELVDTSVALPMLLSSGMILLGMGVGLFIPRMYNRRDEPTLHRCASKVILCKAR